MQRSSLGSAQHQTQTAFFLQTHLNFVLTFNDTYWGRNCGTARKVKNFSSCRYSYRYPAGIAHLLVPLSEPLPSIDADANVRRKRFGMNNKGLEAADPELSKVFTDGLLWT